MTFKKKKNCFYFNAIWKKGKKRRMKACQTRCFFYDRDSFRERDKKSIFTIYSIFLPFVNTICSRMLLRAKAGKTIK